jgi:TPP-dependent pyruvate/acetoin dehydrogenase alpha subunit
VVYESLNLASLYKLPILFVVENNHIAQTTPLELAMAGNILSRFQAFGIPVSELDTSDVVEVLSHARVLMGEVRNTQSPRALVLHTCRFAPHSKGDDSRSPQAIAEMRERRDPLRIHGLRLEAQKREAIQASVETEIQQGFHQALQDPYPDRNM